MPFYDDGLPYSPKNIDKPIPSILNLGRVIKVYPMDMCADIVFFREMDFASPGNNAGGRGLYGYKVPIMSSFAGSFGYENWYKEDASKNYKKGYGSYCSVRAGDIVVVGFLDNDYTQPIILGSMHYFYRDENITGKTKDFEDEEGPSENGVTGQDEERYVTVYPSMVWWKVNKKGEMEISFPLGKGFNELGGLFIKIGSEDIVQEAESMVNNLMRAKDRLEELKKAASILDIPEVQNIISEYESEGSDLSEVIDKVLSIKEVQKILSGDPNIEEEYDDGGCCCDAEDSSSCSCGAGWETCPNCGSSVSGCPYSSSWTCSNCGSTVSNPGA